MISSIDMYNLLREKIGDQQAKTHVEQCTVESFEKEGGYWRKDGNAQMDDRAVYAFLCRYDRLSHKIFLAVKTPAVRK